MNLQLNASTKTPFLIHSNKLKELKTIAIYGEFDHITYDYLV